MKKYVCRVCDWVYDPAIGDPEGGIAPGTPFEEIPDSWVCPVCGVGKEDFEMVPDEGCLPADAGILYADYQSVSRIL